MKEPILHTPKHFDHTILGNGIVEKQGINDGLSKLSRLNHATSRNAKTNDT